MASDANVSLAIFFGVTMRTLILVIIILLCTPVSADTFKLSNITVVDGDTVRADIHLPFQITLTNKSIRLKDIDAPEVTQRRKSVTVTAEEIERGKAAKAYLQTLLKNGALLEIGHSGYSDKYGRVSGKLLILEKGSRVSVAVPMKAAGYSR
jgi:endonuclease YncB( thermonuclease family)